jgi:Protein of unknown function (DUF4038)
VLWSLTSGAAGEFFGSHDWSFHPGWERRLSTRGLTQVTRLRKLFSTLRWWELVPDTANELVTAGRGTELRTDEPKDVLENDYVTAARTPDGRLAVVYLPTGRTISVNRSAASSGLLIRVHSLAASHRCGTARVIGSGSGPPPA